MKLIRHEEIEGLIICETGLKIGGTRGAAGIGETDNPIIRHPITHFPYIPGSSIKGKLRSLLELKYRADSRQVAEGRPCGCGNCFVCKLFGSSDVRETRSPSRLIFRDARLTEEWEKKLKDSLPGSFVDVKTEIAMDRSSGTAYRGALREQERVPEGAKFEFSFSLRVFEEDKDQMKEFYERLADGFKMLEDDYLGGCGTRGYGKVQVLAFRDERDTEGVSMHKYLRELAQKASL